MTDYQRGVEQASAVYQEIIREYVTENEKLREQIETLVMYVEADGTRYWVDDDGNQHFDHSAVKDDADELRELVRDYEELAAALCDARECDGCPFDSERTICEHMRLIARVGELGVDE